MTEAENVLMHGDVKPYPLIHSLTHSLDKSPKCRYLQMFAKPIFWQYCATECRIYTNVNSDLF